MPKKTDLGNGFTMWFTTEAEVKGVTGIVVTGPAAPQCIYRGTLPADEFTGFCSGGVFFENSEYAKKVGRPRWTVKNISPLTLEPSIQCKCGGQHGFIREGKYEPA